MPRLPSFWPVLASAVMILVSCGKSDSPSGPIDSAPPHAARVEITPGTDQTITYGSQLALSASVFDQDGAVMQGASVSWASDASEVARVDANGRVEGRGVGSARITASSGSASASITVAVDQAQVPLALSVTAAPPFALVTLTGPEGSTLQAGEAISGTLGSQSVEAFVTGANTLVLQVPALEAGSHDGRIQLSPNEVGGFTLTVSTEPTWSEPDVVASSVVEGVEGVLTSLGDVPVEYASASVVAREALELFQARFSALTPEARRVVARTIQANADLFLSQVPAGAAAATEEELTSEALERLKAVNAELLWLKKRRGEMMLIKLRLPDGTEMTHNGTIDAAIAAAEAGRVQEQEWTLVRWVRSLIPLKKMPSPHSTRYTAVGVRGALEANADPAGAAEEGRLLEGSTYAVELSVIMQTVNPRESIPGPLAPLVEVVSDFATLRSDFQTFIAALEDIVNGLQGPPPAFPDPPLEGPADIQGTQLSFGAFTHSKVSCAASQVDGHFAVRCTTTSLNDEVVTLPITVTTDFDAHTFDVEATVRPVHVLSYVSGNEQTGDPGTKLGQPLRVKVSDVEGNPVQGMAVGWTVSSGGGMLSASSVLTGSDGRASAEWTLGPGGQQVVEARAIEGWGEAVAGSPIAFTAAGSTAVYDGSVSARWGYVETTNGQGLCTYDQPGSGSVTVLADGGSVHVSITGNFVPGPGEPSNDSHSCDVFPIATSFIWEGTGSRSGDTFSVTISAPMVAGFDKGTVQVSGMISPDGTLSGTIEGHSSWSDEGMSGVETVQGSFEAVLR